MFFGAQMLEAERKLGNFYHLLNAELNTRLLHRAATDRVDNESFVREEFGCAWRNISVMYQICIDSSETFTKSVEEFGIYAESTEENFKRTKSLFTFFASGLASLESASYSFLLLGSLTGHNRFKLETRTPKLSPNDILSKYISAFSAEKLTSSLGYVNSTEYQEWKDLRNTLSHRSLPIFHIVIGENAKTCKWTLPNGVELDFDEDTTSQRLDWIHQNLVDLIENGYEFFQKEIR